MGDDLTDVLDELRAVAHGIYPQLLTDEGLSAAALHDAAPRIPVPVEVDAHDVGRLPEETEVAVYYTVRRCSTSSSTAATSSTRASWCAARGVRSISASPMTAPASPYGTAAAAAG